MPIPQRQAIPQRMRAQKSDYSVIWATEMSCHILIRGTIYGVSQDNAKTDSLEETASLPVCDKEDVKNPLFRLIYESRALCIHI